MPVGAVHSGLVSSAGEGFGAELMLPRVLCLGQAAGLPVGDVLSLLLFS
ncbi:protein of unknown function [Xenorhabdus poinarii G6]|uniref:Uncharacterized protein n=1 Tax=Xenorhabdus poinarii G6 TaxID=1354304 RepID=A0A068R7K1_9GAMM|nr:hypothetical protein [Xenorhabdus poinarii]CDG22896.1 protein of unknown function [Xenorhabdus poinarii G6]